MTTKLRRLVEEHISRKINEYRFENFIEERQGDIQEFVADLWKEWEAENEN